MIPSETITSINDIRQAFLDALDDLRKVPSYSALSSTSSELAADFARVAETAAKPNVAKACSGEMTCAIIGSSGHGKTTILDEMFPHLAERGWLETDVTDTTSQALRVRWAAPDDPRAEDVSVRSWSIGQLKQLMSHAAVREQNERDSIEVTYLESGIVVDGSHATVDQVDLAEWRYPRRVELEPFGETYAVPADKARDRRFIRSLTVKEQSAVLETGPILSHAGRDYDALQLRALVGEVALRDPYDRIQTWAEGDAEQVRKLSFVDTPGLGVGSVVKDEVLRHFLGKKSNQIALELLRNDELDIVLHLVLCGQKSQFDTLWTEIEREWGRVEMEGIADRLVLAVNGMNIYFTNPDIRAKYTDAATTAREGDHFAATLEDNILQRMSPRGQIRPARIVFLDSKNIVDAFGDYQEFYGRHRKTMEAWVEPGGTGHDTLQRLGCLESFRDNIDALADPDDRGQGYLLRQVLSLIEEKGEAILLRKHLVRTGLLRGLAALHELISRFYDTEGRLNTTAANEALAQCLSFLDKNDLGTIERFAQRELDPYIDGIVPADDAGGDWGRDAGGAWVVAAFGRVCELVKEAIIDAGGGKIPAPIWNEFCRVFDGLREQWSRRWGYQDAALPAPPDAVIGTSELVVHCLRLHAREILFQLLTRDAASDRGAALTQDDDDRQQIAAILRSLEAASTAGSKACATHGVDV
ncbi:MAG: hypothetical protein AAF628_07635 [Planctomycetota bacterium]